MLLSRRDFIPAVGLAAAGAYAALRRDPPLARAARKSPVVILRDQGYSPALSDTIYRGIEESGFSFRGKRVLLKPNLVEFDRNTCINTDARFVVASMEALKRLGAAEIGIGEGPGHRRDTLDLAEAARYREIIPKFESIFTDLNRDDVALVNNFLDEQSMYFSKQVLRADIIVSLAKMKTHHWAGATLSMKNFFGLVPGSIYGWPKNQLHYYGIDTSILALHRQFAAKSFALIDGIIGMQGNGPIQGTPKEAGVVVLGQDLRAVDATCCRIMAIDPAKLRYLSDSSSGNWLPDDVDQRGERVAGVRSAFELIPALQHLRSS